MQSGTALHPRRALLLVLRAMLVARNASALVGQSEADRPRFSECPGEAATSSRGTAGLPMFRNGGDFRFLPRCLRSHQQRKISWCAMNRADYLYVAVVVVSLAAATWIWVSASG